jgi:hypothetical protein
MESLKRRWVGLRQGVCGLERGGHAGLVAICSADPTVEPLTASKKMRTDSRADWRG